MGALEMQYVLQHIVCNVLFEIMEWFKQVWLISSEQLSLPP